MVPERGQDPTQVIRTVGLDRVGLEHIQRCQRHAVENAGLCAVAFGNTIAVGVKIRPTR